MPLAELNKLNLLHALVAIIFTSSYSFADTYELSLPVDFISKAKLYGYEKAIFTDFRSDGDTSSTILFKEKTSTGEQEPMMFDTRIGYVGSEKSILFSSTGGRCKETGNVVDAIIKVNGQPINASSLCISYPSGSFRKVYIPQSDAGLDFIKAQMSSNDKLIFVEYSRGEGNIPLDISGFKEAWASFKKPL
jgi:hypothetical protein